MSKGKLVNKISSETFYFAIDEWFRDYRFGINRHPWELSPDYYEERDTIYVTGRLRNKTRRKIDRGKLHLLASYQPRNERGEGAERIGNAWVENGILNCSAWIESDVFYSVTPALAANCFQEMSFTVCNLRYNRGTTDFFTLDHELSDMEEEE